MIDYINGKRQASFPPVKMLMVMALIFFLLKNLLGINYDEISGDFSSIGYERLQESLVVWLGNNIAWTVLMAFSLFIIPIWFLFRQAPRFPRHTLPQGFYIQVLIGVQFLMFMSLMIILFSFIPSLSGDGETAMSIVVSCILPIIAIIDYKQLFGYRWWGTLWRVLFCALISFLGMKLLFAAGGVVYYILAWDEHEIAKYGMKCINHLSTIWVLFEIVNIINTRPWQNNHWPKTLWRPVLALVTLLLVAYISMRLGYDNSIQSVIESFT